ncbi:MAG: STAS domain-containing protein [Phycisphaerales bacterium]|nr:STAS domain-containing protein [Phycisphaerales bacterium]
MAAAAKLLIHPIKDATIVNIEELRILDSLEVEQIGAELYSLVDDKNRKKLIIDFTKVRILSSSALGMLLTLRKKAEAIKGTLILCGLRDDLKKVFKISGLDRLFTFAENEEAALSMFGITPAG